MMWSVLLVHLTGGRIETHFHIFGSLAFLAFYRDWRVLIPATVIVAVEHLTLQIYWPESIYGILAPESWRFLEHAFWVVFEDIFLMLSCIASVQEMKSLAAQQARIEVTDRLEREMEIATHIQTSILPRHIDVEGLQAAAAMHPTAEVGGDYYEVLPVPGGCWIAIGDVAGHGLKAGLVMLQTQSAVEALVSGHPDGSPNKILRSVNRVLFENVRKRLGSDEYVTMSLLRYTTTTGASSARALTRSATSSGARRPGAASGSPSPGRGSGRSRTSAPRTSRRPTHSRTETCWSSIRMASRRLAARRASSSGYTASAKGSRRPAARRSTTSATASWPPPRGGPQAARTTT